MKVELVTSEGDCSVVLSANRNASTTGAGENAISDKHEMGSLPVVPERTVGVKVSAGKVLPVKLDGKILPLIWSDDGRTGYAQIDLTNQVGYHRISIRHGLQKQSYDFKTATTKATLQEILLMAEEVVEQVLSLRRQFFYSLPNGERRAVSLPRVEFLWLREHIDEIKRLAESIRHRPGTEGIRRVVTSRSSSRVALASTLRHIRENPSTLESAKDGIINHDGERYWPNSVKTRISSRETAEKEHRSITQFLEALARTALRLEEQMELSHSTSSKEWTRQLRALLGTRFFQRYAQGKQAVMSSRVPTRLQQRDRRYRRLREMQATFGKDISPLSTKRTVNSLRNNISDVWEIYQAYVAHRIGAALSLEHTSDNADLRARDSEGRSMSSPRYDLYYDTKPSADVLVSWRDGSARPDQGRPDILLHEKETGRTVVLDVKFSLGSNERHPPGAALREMQAYMQSYGIDASGVVFPGEATSLADVEGNGNRIRQIPLLPSGQSSSENESEIMNALEGLWT